MLSAHGTRRPDREAEQSVFWKRFDHPAGKPAMALPMIQQRLGVEYGLRLGCCHRASLEANPDNFCREFMAA
jgi:hypothetical protein